MNKDETLIELVKSYRNENYFSITYMCIEGSANAISSVASFGTTAGYFLGGAVGGGFAGAMGALSNDFGVMIANDECLCIYVLRKLCIKINKENVKCILIIPYKEIFKLRIKKFLVWRMLSIYFFHNTIKQKIKILISSKVIGIKKQKENVNKLIIFLKELKQAI